MTNARCVGCGRKLYKGVLEPVEVSRSIYLKVALVVAVVVVVAGALAFSTRLLGILPGESSSSETAGATPSQLQLIMEGVTMQDYWRRGGNDLPETSSILSFSMHEQHGRVFEGEVTFSIDGAVIYRTKHRGELGYTVKVWGIRSGYDEFHNVTVRVVGPGGEQVAKTLDWNPVFPRSPVRVDSCYSLMITPREETVVATLEEIKESASWTWEYGAHWKLLQTWVSSYVEFDWSKVPDDDPDLRKPVGAEPYDPDIGARWNFPFETIDTGLGVCRDYAILYCSLLRADGWPPNDVYVGLSREHAYVLLHPVPELPRDLGWFILDPQASGWVVVDLSDPTDPLAGMYDTRYYFNDHGFHVGVPWRD